MHSYRGQHFLRSNFCLAATAFNHWRYADTLPPPSCSSSTSSCTASYLPPCPPVPTRQPTYLPGPERIPKTNGRSKVYLNNANMGDIGAKLVAAELRDNKDCTSLWSDAEPHTPSYIVEGSKDCTLTLLNFRGTHSPPYGNPAATPDAHSDLFCCGGLAGCMAMGSRILVPLSWPRGSKQTAPSPSSTSTTTG